MLWESHRTCDFFDERDRITLRITEVASFPSAAPRKHANPPAAPSKDMMHTNQLKDYEDELIAKRLEELHEDEVQTMAFFG